MKVHPGLKLSFRILGALLLLSGLLPLALGIWTYSSTRSFLDTAQPAQGKVIELVEQQSSDGGSTYAPRVRFQDEEGEVYEVTSSSSSSPPRYRVGEEVAILYDPQRPQDFRMNTWFGLWGGPLIGFTVFLGAVIFALILAFLGPLILQGILSAVRETSAGAPAPERREED